MEPHNIEMAKRAGDYVFGGVTLATLFSYLPQATALLAFIWWVIRLYETRTLQRWLRKLRGRR